MLGLLIVTICRNKFKKMKIIMRLNLITIKLMTIILFATSCVGTVKDKNATKGNVLSSGASSKGISFSGLVKAIAVSHDKVELSFFPASGDQNNLTYEVFINGSPVSIKTSGRSLTMNSKGLMTTTIVGLSINTSYNFNMKVSISGTASSTLLDPSKSLTVFPFL